MHRLPFLPGGRSRTTAARRALSREKTGPRLEPGEIVSALVGDLLIWSGIVHRGVKLDDLEPGLAARRARLARRLSVERHPGSRARSRLCRLLRRLSAGTTHDFGPVEPGRGGAS